jgi:DNA-binding NtrC family response regulator
MNERFGSSKRMSDDALGVLRRHSWPGNVRELLHAVEGAMVVCEGTEIRPEHLPQSVRGPIARSSPNGTEKLPTLDELERTHIRLVLQSSGGHRGNAARTLGISERNLYRKLRELGLLD